MGEKLDLRAYDCKTNSVSEQGPHDASEMCESAVFTIVWTCYLGHWPRWRNSVGGPESQIMNRELETREGARSIFYRVDRIATSRMVQGGYACSGYVALADIRATVNRYSADKKEKWLYMGTCANELSRNGVDDHEGGSTKDELVARRAKSPRYRLSVSNFLNHARLVRID